MRSLSLSLSVNFNLLFSVPASMSPFLTWAAASLPYLGRDFAPATNQVCWELHLGPSTALPTRAYVDALEVGQRSSRGPRGHTGQTADGQMDGEIGRASCRERV